MKNGLKYIDDSSAFPVLRYITTPNTNLPITATYNTTMKMVT